MRNWSPGEVNQFGNEIMIFRNSSADCDIQAVISTSEHATEFYNANLGCSPQHLTTLQQPDNVGFKCCEEIRLEQFEILAQWNLQTERKLSLH